MVPESIRIRFEKKGRLRYISHLDLCRTMCPAMIRAKIPLWYTEGINPHPKLVFAQPLPLFVESRCEFLDIKITEPMPCDEIKRRLKAAFTEELNVLDVYKPRSDFSQIKYAHYEITGINVCAQTLKSFMSGSVNVVKKSKKGEEKVVDIRPQINSVKLRPDGAVEAVLDASQASYLNPEIFAEALAKAQGIDEPDFDIVRVKWLLDDLSVFR